jgi:tRNA(Arg) A34 adenosine deaminase TadA
MNETDHKHLLRSVELAEAALASGNDPFGSLLVSASGEVLFEEHNWESTGDATRHPEIDIAKWAATHMSAADRAAATVYTSGEHCPMCAAAHAWVGLGRIVYAVSSAQLNDWRTAMGAAPSPVSVLPISAIAPGLPVDGPDPALAERMHELHRRSYLRSRS